MTGRKRTSKLAAVAALAALATAHDDGRCDGFRLGRNSERRRADRRRRPGADRHHTEHPAAAEQARPRPLARWGDDHRVLAVTGVLVRRQARQDPWADRHAPDRLAVLGDRGLDAGRGHRARRPAVPHRIAGRWWLGDCRRHVDVAFRRLARGAPFWRAGGYWRNSRRAVTFPLAAGGWSAGPGRKYVPLPDVSFAPGGAPRLRYYQSIAVDPGVIPLGSRVYVPAYRNDGHGGWFIAQDTGGAINGRHIDVYRPPPPTARQRGAIPRRSADLRHQAPGLKSAARAAHARTRLHRRCQSSSA